MEENRKVLLAFWYLVLAVAFIMGVSMLIDGTYYHKNSETILHGKYAFFASFIAFFITQVKITLKNNKRERIRAARRRRNPIDL